jgi:hypothetical protein
MNGLEALKSLSQMVDTGLDYTQEDKEREVSIIEKELKKSSELEDIEDKWGIDLITLSKALTNGIWVKLEYFGCKTTNIVFEKAFYFGKVIDEEKPVIRADLREYYLKDYGKTWALTKGDTNDLCRNQMHTPIPRN